jgi:hypothetical protein
MKLKALTATVAVLMSLPQAYAGSIFDNTPFKGVADAVGNATGTNNLQQKLGLPNAGGDIANFFEAAKKNAGPLVTTITTLNCPGCVAAAAVVSGSGAALEAVFTTGIVTTAFQADPLLGLATVVVLASDKSSGETGFQQVVVQTEKKEKSKNTYTLSADCIIRDKAHDTYFVLYEKAPDKSHSFVNGDVLVLTAPDCKSKVSDPSNESVTSVSIIRTGANPLNLSEGRFRYVIVGTKAS